MAGCASIPDVPRTNLDPDLAYIQQLNTKYSTFNLLNCSLININQTKANQIKIEDQIHYPVPEGNHVLTVQVFFTASNVFRAPGKIQVQLPAELKKNHHYEFSCERNKTDFTLFLRETESGAIVSPELKFSAQNPIIIPIPIP